MRKLSVYMGGRYDILHVAQFSCKFHIPAERLAEEIGKRSSGQYRNSCKSVLIERLPDKLIGGRTRFVYQVTIGLESALPDFFELVEGIEKSIEESKEVIRLANMDSHEEEDNAAHKTGS